MGERRSGSSRSWEGLVVLQTKGFSLVNEADTVVVGVFEESTSLLRVEGKDFWYKAC